ncbi:DUF1835 domain-containing protein [Winogradskyella immobilis]|uniref:DUF1835 domain-containing protein n=1 Tax=Winogradskyella immobilis TaxID=2816852 RepID=A0ABS8ES11_9FLAO|nr:DUF1835 domain-containing protein [Winogradskyella immobilis]MCC1485097.1 DUF1835 domain-containing protein [Winogradskyella immobilis]MCG0017189.1 DUF1835 domain-containing protein [Winogradskyella immobilis]
MTKRILHITNGDALTDYLRELNYTHDILTWREMLCEGPTIPAINEEFFSIRRQFLTNQYNIKTDRYNLDKDLKILEQADQYTEIILWFEYDLFCHINMIGVINLLHQKEINKPLYLVCSGRVKGEKSLKGLGELNPDQLDQHYKNKVQITEKDKALAIALWRTYCGKDHNILKPYITKNSSFKYLSNCLKAHLKRFPNQKTGLSIIEENILKIIKDQDIKSKHHLLGYCLSHQGFYGFGDTQFKRIIDKLNPFFTIENTSLKLNRKGHEALLGHHNFALEVNNDMAFGGLSRLDYQFSDAENKLIKTVFNAN